MRKILSITIGILICLAAAQALAEQDGLYTYSINPDNTVTITGFDWKNNHGDIYIPEMLGNRMVSGIGEKAFMTTGNTAVKITLPDNIKSIGEQAFRGVAITYVNIPLNTLEIGGGAFAQCTVSRFNVASGHQVFATIDNALYNKQTKTLIAWPENKEISEIPNGIVNIGDFAFYGRHIDFLALPKTVNYIGKYAFSEITGANRLNHTRARLEVYANHLDDYSFYKADIWIDNQMSLKRIGNHAFEEADFKFKTHKYDYTLHNNKYYALLGTISTTPYQIGDYAFYRSSTDCDISLKNVTSIGEYAFAMRRGTSALYEDELKNIVHIGEFAFYKSYTSYISGLLASLSLVNEGVDIISPYAFSDSYVTDVLIGPSIKRIARNAFENSKYLTNVTLSSGLLFIEDNAFANTNVSKVNIPETVTMIGNGVFDGCPLDLVLTVEAGSYGEVWARTSGYAYVVNGQEEDTSWLNN